MLYQSEVAVRNCQLLVWADVGEKDAPESRVRNTPDPLAEAAARTPFEDVITLVHGREVIGSVVQVTAASTDL